ncbi:hypothetical protein FA09DRAFT_341859, partial [Tilletiopsis washingtonensis]
MSQLTPAAGPSRPRTPSMPPHTPPPPAESYDAPSPSPERSEKAPRGDGDAQQEQEAERARLAMEEKQWLVAFDHLDAQDPRNLRFRHKWLILGVCFLIEAWANT